MNLDKIISLDYGICREEWVWDTKRECWRPLDDSVFASAVSGYSQLNEKSRSKARKKALSKTEVVSVKLPDTLLGAKPVKRPEGAGATAFLQLCSLFNSSAGVEIVAKILCGLRCSVLRAAEPSLRFVTSLGQTAGPLEAVFGTIMKVISPRHTWRDKGWKIKRRNVLDYSGGSSSSPHHAIDFTQVTIKKAEPKLKTPYPYRNTAILVCGADAPQLRELEPYMEDTAVFLINCGAKDLAAPKVHLSRMDEYDPKVLEELKMHPKDIAKLLSRWAVTGGDSWAVNIFDRAKTVIGKPDERFIQVTYNARLLLRAVEYQVFLSFLDMLDELEVLPPDELERYRSQVKGVYVPEPGPQTVVRKMEDPEVFLTAVRSILSDPHTRIIPDGEQCRRKDKPLGAWRRIGGVSYLILDEARFMKAYPKAARTAGADTSVTSTTAWKMELLKSLRAEKIIKTVGSNPRYRFDLYEEGKRDSTYVVAIPRALLPVSEASAKKRASS